MAKVLFLTDELSVGGVSSFVITLANELTKRGHKITIGINRENSELLGTVCEKIQVKQFPVSDFDTRASITRNVKKWIIANGIETVIFNNCYYVDSYCIKGLEVQGIYIFHGNSSFEISRFLKEGLFCETVIAINKEMWEMCQHSLGKYKIVKIPHGTSVPIVAPIKEHNKFCITYLGRIAEEKGVEKLKEIVVPILNKYHNTRFYLIGENREDPRYEKWITEEIEIGLNNRAQFFHQVLNERKQIQELLIQTHVLIGPSNTEAFGLSFIEAAAFGAVPVISRLEGVTDEIFKNNEQAILVDKNDINGFQNGINELYLDRKYWNQMSMNAYERVKNYYSIEQMTTEYEKIIKKQQVKFHLTRNLRQKIFKLYRHILFLNLRKRLN